MIAMAEVLGKHERAPLNHAHIHIDPEKVSNVQQTKRDQEGRAVKLC